MPWTTLPTFTDGNVLTGSQLNAMKDNINETAPAKATASGGFIISSGVNQVTRRLPSFGFTSGDDTTTSLTYVTITNGPATTAATGTLVWCFITALMSNLTAGQGARMSIDVIGAHTPSDSTALVADTSDIGQATRATALLRISGLTAGNNTFTPVYRATGGTARFRQRRVDVLQID